MLCVLFLPSPRRRTRRLLEEPSTSTPPAHTAHTLPTVAHGAGQQSLTEKIEDRFSFPFCFLRKFCRTAPGVGNAGHHEICPL